jgi:hypothetical protein
MRPTSPVLNQQVGGELVGRLLRHAPVALEDVGALDLDAADLAGGSGRPCRRCTRTPTPGSGSPTVPPRRALRAIGVGGEHHRLAHAVALEDGVAGALAPVVEGLDQQRRRAADEQPHVAAGVPRQRRFAQHAHVQRGHAHEHRGLGQPRDHRAGRTWANQIIRLPLSSAPWLATNRPCTWKMGSAWISSHVAAAASPSSP